MNNSTLSSNSEAIKKLFLSRKGAESADLVQVGNKSAEQAVCPVCLHDSSGISVVN